MKAAVYDLAPIFMALAVLAILVSIGVAFPALMEWNWQRHEITNSQYDDINTWVKRYPEISSDYLTYIQDGIIDGWEFDALRNLKQQCRTNHIKKDIQNQIHATIMEQINVKHN
jgi:type III secretory pathway component EscR